MVNGRGLLISFSLMELAMSKMQGESSWLVTHGLHLDMGLNMFVHFSSVMSTTAFAHSSVCATSPASCAMYLDPQGIKQKPCLIYVAASTIMEGYLGS